MMQNNFTQFRKYIEALVLNAQFIIIQIIKRNKDNHDVKGNNYARSIKHYFIDSIERYDKYQDEIIRLCETEAARAYIDLQPRTWYDYTMELNWELANRIKTGDFARIDRLPFKAATRCPRTREMWVVDIDGEQDYMPVYNYLSEDIHPELPFGGERATIYEVVRTHSGHHLITGKFDTREFVEKFPNVEIKHNNSTLLYYPRSLDK